jgi:hypothetical protein
MVSYPDDADMSDLGFVSTNLDKVSTDDANDFLGLGAPRQPVFERLEFPMNDRVDLSFS